MLRKIRINIDQREKIVSSLPLIISVNSESDYSGAKIILENHPHSLKGIELSLTLAKNLQSEIQASQISYLSIHLDEPLHENIFKPFFQKHRVVEIFLPASLFVPNSLRLLKGASKIILNVRGESELNQVHPFISEMILLSIFPLIQGAPFCKIPIEHSLEFYEHTNASSTIENPKKTQACPTCAFIGHTACHEQGFSPTPLSDKEKYKEAMFFLDDENPTARF